MNNKTLILCWREPTSREWITVGKLWKQDDKYRFCYTKGVDKAEKSGNFALFGQMDEKDKTYVSDELFPIFKNRLLQKSRPEYQEYLDWLGLDKTLEPLDELSRTNGVRATDSLQLFEVPTKKDEKYITYFFSHGISHLPKNYVERIKKLKKGDKLFLMQDIQNKIDQYALMIRTDDPAELMGYCPRIYTKDLNSLIQQNGARNIYLTIETINHDAPLQFRLLCKLETEWFLGFKPFTDEDFQEYGK
jgi:hypothetical protein